MDLATFTDLINEYRFGFRLSTVSEGSLRLEGHSALREPDPEDPLKRVFLLFAISSSTRTGISVQAELRKAVERVVSDVCHPDGIFEKQDELRKTLTLIIDRNFYNPTRGV